MPQYRNPFEKGRLIIAFSVKFPPKQWLGGDTKKLTSLEALLPPRTEVLVPEGAEECLLTEIDPETLGGSAGGRHQRHGEACDEDEEGPGGMHGQRVQCAQH